MLSLAEGLLRSRLGLGQQQLQASLLGEHGGVSPAWGPLGGPTAAMPTASLAAWAGEAPALLARLVPVRCIPAEERSPRRRHPASLQGS